MEYKLDDLVWAKMKGFQAWPGKVIEPKPEVKRPSDKKPKQFIFFFGSENYAWITEDLIWPYGEYRDKYKSNQRPSRVFQEAVDTAEELFKAFPAEKAKARSKSPSPAPAEPDIGDVVVPVSPDVEKKSMPSARVREKKSIEKSAEKKAAQKALKKASKVKEDIKDLKAKKSASKLKEDVKETKTTKELLGDSVKRKKRAIDRAVISPSPPLKARLLDKPTPLSIPSSSYDFDDDMKRQPLVSRVSQLENRSLLSDQAFLPDVLPSLSDTFVSKKIIATPMKIGFLGLGLIGSGAVDSLLRSGHEVTIWNRTASKCREFIKEGALKGNNPSEVVQSCDITFACVSDTAALKDIVFGNCGVLQGISQGKSFVNMSTTDVESAHDVCEAVITRGGRFLEAPVIGSKQLAKDGQLVVIAAGDKTLYDDCQSCLQAMARHMFYIGEMGSASKMKIVLNMLMGTMLAGLAESMALAEKIGLNTVEVLNILSHTVGSSALLRNKGTEMALSKISEPSCKLQTLQKDLRLAINMSDAVDQPLHVGAAVNELFKKAKAKGYGDYDIAAVYRAADL